MTKNILQFFLVSLVVLITGCSANNVDDKSNTLYHKLGGSEGIENIVDTFVVKIAHDPQIFPYFAKASVSHFKKGLFEHLCHISDGPCQYQGDSMIDIHTGMNINEADFNRVVELLVETLEESNISYPVQNKVLAKLTPLRKDIIKL